MSLASLILAVFAGPTRSSHGGVHSGRPDVVVVGAIVVVDAALVVLGAVVVGAVVLVDVVVGAALVFGAVVVGAVDASAPQAASRSTITATSRRMSGVSHDARLAVV